MKRYVLIILYIFFAVLFQTNLWAADEFGQSIPEDLEKKLEDAKQKRIPDNEKYDIQSSISILEELTRNKPNYYRAYYNLALAYAENNDYEKSIRNFDIALKIREDEKISDATIYNAAGWVNMKSSHYDKAQTLFLEGIRLIKPDNNEYNKALYSNIGLLYFYTQKFVEAKKYLMSAVALGSDSARNTLDIIEKLEKKNNAIP